MIPSLLQIPSAVSDSKLHSVLPNNGKGDFQFDRSTGATRINRDGLIEEVGYFSSELVQNGNFSELGSEALINGDFATDSDWTKGTGWVIMNGYAESDGTNAPLDQVSRLTIGKTYKVVITVTNMTSSALSVRLGTSSSNAVLSILENGTYTAYGVAGATTFRLRSQGFDGRIQNVSVKQVDPNDRWSLVDIKFTGANTFENTATNGRIFQSFTTIVGSKYKVSATINSGTWNVVASTNNNTSGQIVLTGNTITSEFFEFTATATTSFLALYNIGASGSVASITNISVVEVQGDRPRLSYDITNGVVEDKPHLLLEPSATNYSTNSENPLSWFYVEYGSGSAGTITTGKTDMFGSTNAVQVDFPANAENASLWFGSLTSALSSGTETSSVYIKLVGDDTSDKNIQIRTGGIASAITISGTEFVRYTASKTISSNEGINLKVRPSQGTSSGGFSIIVCQPQSEATAYATSYIPTAGTTITRAAETCNNSKPSVNSTEGVLYAEVKHEAQHTAFKEISISDGTMSNRITFYNPTASDALGVSVVSSGSVAVNDYVSGVDLYSFSKYAFQYKQNDFKVFVNGELKFTDTSGNTPTGLSQVQFAKGDPTGSYFYGKVKGLAVYNEALSESQLMQLTGITASSIYNNFVTRTASFTVEALNEVKKVIDNL